MQPTTQYELEKYLKDRKEAGATKPPREPSGFMKKPRRAKLPTQDPRKRTAR